MEGRFRRAEGEGRRDFLPSQADTFVQANLKASGHFGRIDGREAMFLQTARTALGHCRC
jgi:hypothetical protein